VQHSSQERLPYALIQVSCAVRLNRDPRGSSKHDELGPSAKVFENVEKDLKHFKVSEEPPFDVEHLYKWKGVEAGPRGSAGEQSPDPELLGFTLLNACHRYVKICDCLRNPASSSFPHALRWPGRPQSSELGALWDQCIRVQTAWDDEEKTDINDWLISSKGGDSCGLKDELDKLREFFAWLFAQRRQAVFASYISDRSYNVWLPPALLKPVGGTTSRPQDERLAVLPFLTLLRLPGQAAWRPTVTVTVLFVPVKRGTKNGQCVLQPRPLGDAAEAYRIVSALEGSTSQALKSSLARFSLESGGLEDYLAMMAEPGCFRAPGARASDAPGGWTIRMWLEAILLTVATRAPQSRRGSRRGQGMRRWRNRPADRPCRAASEVARALRLTSVWSVLLLSQEEIMWGELDSRYIPLEGRAAKEWHAAANAQVAGLPRDLFRAVDELRGIGHLPTMADRVDDVSTVDRHGGMTWRMHRSRCLLSVQSAHDDHFPGISPLNSFARLGVMVIAASAIREMTQALMHQSARAQGSANLAALEQDLLIELEEIYAIDIVGPGFCRFYRNLRKQLDLDKDYRQVRERLQSLSAASNQVETIRSSKHTIVVAIAAAAFTAVFLLQPLYSGLVASLTGRSHIGGWAAIVLSAAILAGAFIVVLRISKPKKTTELFSFP
jgi:hypothetical protein